MEIDHQAKRLIFTVEELTDSRDFLEIDEELFSTLLSVMAYPNDPDKQHLYTVGLRSKNIEKLTELTSEDEADSFRKSEPELLLDLYKNEIEGLKKYNAARKSRNKKHSGTLFVRGIAAGYALIHLVFYDKNLTEAYDLAVKDLQDTEDPVEVSRQWVVKAWGQYQHVSHLWAAYIICSGISAKKPPVPLSAFLRIASYLRNELVNSIDPNKSSGLHRPEERYRCKDPEKIWLVTDHDKKPIPTGHDKAPTP